MFTLPIATATPFAQPFQAQHQAAVNEHAAKNVITNIPKGRAGDASMLLSYDSTMNLNQWNSLESNLRANKDNGNAQMRSEGIDPANEAQIWPVAQGLAAAEGLSSFGSNTRITRSTPGGRIGYMHLDRESARIWRDQLEKQKSSPLPWMRPSEQELSDVDEYISQAFNGNPDASHARALAYWVKQKARLAKASTGVIDPKAPGINVKIEKATRLSNLASTYGVKVSEIRYDDGTVPDARTLKLGRTLVIPSKTYTNPTAYQIRMASAGGAEGTIESNPNDPKQDYNQKAEAVQKEVNRRSREEISKSK